MRKDTCERTSKSLHRYVEGELQRLESTLVREHLEDCARCRDAEAALRAEQVWLLEHLLDSPPLSSRLSEKIARRIESSRRTPRRARAPSRSRASAVQPRRDRPVRWEVVATAAAAIAVLVLVRAVPTSTPGISLSAPGPERSATEPEPVPGRGGPTVVTERHDAALADTPRRDARPDDGAALLHRTGVREPTGRAGDTVAAASVLAAPAGRSAHRTNWSWRRAERLNLAHVVDMAHSFSQPERRTMPEKFPCEADPNDDGKTDLNDIAFSCQVLLGRQSLIDALSRATADGEPGSLNDLECEEDCLRV